MKRFSAQAFASRKTQSPKHSVMQILQTKASEVFQVLQITYFSGWVRTAVNISLPAVSLGSTFTSGFPKTTPLSQSSCFSSNAWPPAARTARGSGRRPAQACSSAVRQCSRCGKGKPAYTSRSRWKEGQSRGWSVEKRRLGKENGCISQCCALVV